jgi:hypothetical protein
MLNEDIRVFLSSIKSSNFFSIKFHGSRSISSMSNIENEKNQGERGNLMDIGQIYRKYSLFILIKMGVS